MYVIYVLFPLGLQQLYNIHRHCLPLSPVPSLLPQFHLVLIPPFPPPPEYTYARTSFQYFSFARKKYPSKSAQRPSCAEPVFINFCSLESVVSEGYFYCIEKPVLFQISIIFTFLPFVFCWIFSLYIACFFNFFHNSLTPPLYSPPSEV